MVYDENTPYLGDSHEGDTATIVSNVGGRKDRNFARNWSWAKYAADRGILARIVVNVVANGETYRTVDAFKRAVGAGHPSAHALVTHATRVEDAMAIVDPIAAVMPLLSTEGEPAILDGPVAAESAETAPVTKRARKPVKEPRVPAELAETAVETTAEADTFDASKAEHIAAIT